jgi:predicted nuclease of restriction endonuclease-like (RecB) superfamily
MPEGQDLVPSADLTTLVDDLRDIIAQGRGRAASAVNAEIVATYWQVGERIVREEQAGERRAAYGVRLLALLGKRLSQEFGRGFTETSLQNMRRFYLTYPISSALRRELSWTHYRTLMRLPDDQRAFYEQVAASGRWSSRELERQISSMLYERAALSRRPDELLATVPAGDNALVQRDAFKDPYVLDFLDLEDTFSEKDLEAALIRNIERFLIELGNGFYFGGRQRRITIDDEDYYIDLVFWQRYLNCQAFIDLKIGALTHADISQMQLYLAWARNHDMREGENEPIGLILCGSKKAQVIKLLLADETRTPDDRVKVAQYLLLQSEAAIKQRLAEISAAYEEAQRRTATE